MSAAHHYWILDDTDAAIGAAMRAAGAGIVPGGLATGQGAGRNLALIKVRAEAADTAPAGVTEMGLVAWAGTPATETAPAVVGFSQTGPWVPCTPRTDWTGAEKAVLIPEADAGPQHGDLTTAERVDVAGTICRLIRYTGTKPAALAAYSYIAAADIPATLTQQVP